MAEVWKSAMGYASDVIAYVEESSALSVQNLLFALFAIVVGMIAVVKLREKKLHLPPGPRALPIVGNWLQIGNDINQRNLSDLAQKYGDVYLLQMGMRNLVVVSSAELAKNVLYTQGVEFGSRARNLVLDIFTGSGQDMVFTTYGEHWRRMRRIMTVPFFTNKVVQQSLPAWEDEVNHVIKDLKANPTASTTGTVIRTRLQLMMYNVIYRLMFDRRFEREDDPLYVRLKEVNSLRSKLNQSFDYNYGDFIPVLRPFLKKYLDKCRALKEKRMAIFKDFFIQDRKALLSTRGPANGEKIGMDYIFDSEKSGEINEDNVLYIVENINVAAIETTLWSIEWGVGELINNPHMQTRVRDELDSVLGRGNLLTEADIAKTPYLTAFVKEVLRLHMAIPLLVPHMNLNQTKLAGYDIPAESKVLVNAWWIANNPATWKEPEKFNPDRFLDSSMEAIGNDYNFLPFGAGRRACPGLIIAMPILHLILGRLIQSFVLLPPPEVEKVDLTEKGGQFALFVKNHFNCIVRERTD